MWTTLLAQSDAVAPRHRKVPFEYIGQARLLRQQLLAADDRYHTKFRRLLAPLFARQRRYPGRLQRQEDITEVARAFARLNINRIRWHFDTPAKRRIVITDWRASSSDWLDEKWDEPEWQPGIAVTKFQLTVAEQVEAKGVVICNIALHGLARFLERSARTDMDSLREELAPLITSIARFHAPTPLGFWRGLVVRAKDKDGHEFPSRSVRTWVSSEMVEDVPAQVG